MKSYTVTIKDIKGASTPHVFETKEKQVALNKFNYFVKHRVNNLQFTYNRIGTAEVEITAECHNEKGAITTLDYVGLDKVRGIKCCEISSKQQLDDPIYVNNQYVILSVANPKNGDVAGCIIASGTFDEVLACFNSYPDCRVDIRRIDLYLNDNTKI